MTNTEDDNLCDMVATILSLKEQDPVMYNLFMNGRNSRSAARKTQQEMGVHRCLGCRFFFNNIKELRKHLFPSAKVRGPCVAQLQKLKDQRIEFVHRLGFESVEQTNIGVKEKGTRADQLNWLAINESISSLRKFFRQHRQE
eukprot:GILK01021105.1.p1 GENE.GILK01021105.1~~GILK01021105.1.p1  ORF type:complete len:142 (-),score=13.55 GILK01021105.1:60-485(-)